MSNVELVWFYFFKAFHSLTQLYKKLLVGYFRSEKRVSGRLKLQKTANSGSVLSFYRPAISQSTSAYSLQNRYSILE